MARKFEQLRNATALLLDSDSPAHTLRPEVIEIKTALLNSQTVRPESHLDISGGETRTSNGLALSPEMAAMCADDYMRTIAFIRGSHAAIVDVRKRFPDRPARVLYAGCGPYATLAVPLMTVFSSSEATFTLLDIHPESIMSARSIVDTLCLSDSVAGFETLDAGEYRVSPDQPPDVIIIEVMQAALESEPQVAITRHLLRQAPGAILIPEEVGLDLVLMDPSKEFAMDSEAPLEGYKQRDRIPVGPVFVLNRESVNLWKDITSRRLPGLTVRIPDSLERRYEPMIVTRIRTYRNHLLEVYDSGLTFPRILSTEGAIQAGDRLQFHYDLGQRPRLGHQLTPG